MGNDHHNDTHSDNHKGDERYRRIELITGTKRQLRRSAEERMRIVAESFEPGANVSAVARRYGVNGGLLHYWRKQAKERAREADALTRPVFVPVATPNSLCNAVKENPGRSSSLAGSIEIETCGALIRVSDGVDLKTLSIVLTALRRAS